MSAKKQAKITNAVFPKPRRGRPPVHPAPIREVIKLLADLSDADLEKVITAVIDIHRVRAVEKIEASHNELRRGIR